MGPPCEDKESQHSMKKYFPWPELSRMKERKHLEIDIEVGRDGLFDSLKDFDKFRLCTEIGPQKVIHAIGYYLVCSLVVLTVMNVVHERMPQDIRPLPDIIHDNFPQLKPEHLGDIPFGILIVSVVISCLMDKKKPIFDVLQFLQTTGNSLFITSTYYGGYRAACNE